MMIGARTTRRCCLTSMLLGLVTMQAAGEVSHLPAEPLEHRDLQLTRDLQVALRNRVAHMTASLKEGSNSASYSAELMAHALIGAIEVSGGFLKLRRENLPDWVNYEAMEAGLDLTNRHIERTIGYISSLEDYKRAMSSFPMADMDPNEFRLIPDQIMERIVLESHGIDLPSFEDVPGAVRTVHEDGSVSVDIPGKVLVPVEGTNE